ncbi:hypothetical protein BC831DRAFT_486008 [Entophlyctis helioformis]|nr:hypothetical protein BC831DRAFT_486008 [Entophlyctis helioformis]
MSLLCLPCLVCLTGWLADWLTDQRTDALQAAPASTAADLRSTLGTTAPAGSGSGSGSGSGDLRSQLGASSHAQHHRRNAPPAKASKPPASAYSKPSSKPYSKPYSKPPHTNADRSGNGSSGNDGSNGSSGSPTFNAPVYSDMSAESQAAAQSTASAAEAMDTDESALVTRLTGRLGKQHKIMPSTTPSPAETAKALLSGPALASVASAAAVAGPGAALLKTALASAVSSNAPLMIPSGPLMSRHARVAHVRSTGGMTTDAATAIALGRSMDRGIFVNGSFGRTAMDAMDAEMSSASSYMGRPSMFKPPSHTRAPQSLHQPGFEVQVLNLHPFTSAADLKVAFEACGPVRQVSLVQGTEPDGPVSALINFEEKASVLIAIDQYNNKLADGRILRVISTEHGRSIAGVASSMASGSSPTVTPTLVYNPPPSATQPYWSNSSSSASPRGMRSDY